MPGDGLLVSRFCLADSVTAVIHQGLADVSQWLVTYSIVRSSPKAHERNFTLQMKYICPPLTLPDDQSQGDFTEAALPQSGAVCPLPLHGHDGADGRLSSEWQ